MEKKTIMEIADEIEKLAEQLKQDIEDSKKARGEVFNKIWGITTCDHICTGNCRRVGCNCDCGEWHNT